MNWGYFRRCSIGLGGLCSLSDHVAVSKTALQSSFTLNIDETLFNNYALTKENVELWRDETLSGVPRNDVTFPAILADAEVMFKNATATFDDADGVGTQYAEFERGAEFADRPPVELLQRGSGWGALERLRREARGELPFCSGGLIFDTESLGEAQAGWVSLLRDGRLPALEADADPRAMMVQAEWRELLECAVSAGGGNWSAWLHLGVMRHYAGDHDGAQSAWQRSLEQAKTAWAMRNLAALALKDKRFDDAVELYLSAYRLRPTLLVLECGRALIEAGRPKKWIEIVAQLLESLRAVGRIRLLEGQAALEIGDFETVERLFTDRIVVDDLRDGIDRSPISGSTFTSGV